VLVLTADLELIDVNDDTVDFELWLAEVRVLGVDTEDTEDPDTEVNDDGVDAVDRLRCDCVVYDDTDGVDAEVNVDIETEEPDRLVTELGDADVAVDPVVSVDLDDSVDTLCVDQELLELEVLSEVSDDLDD